MSIADLALAIFAYKLWIIGGLVIAGLVWAVITYVRMRRKQP